MKLVIILEYQNIKIFLQKGYAQVWSEEGFVIKRVKHTVPWTYFISDFKGGEIVGTYYEKESQKKKKKKKKIRKEFRYEKVIKRKGNKLYVKWKGEDNTFNSWIDKKYIV